MKRATLLAVGASALFLVLPACKRQLPVALRFWMSGDGGCAELQRNAKWNGMFCWGPGIATPKTFPDGVPDPLALGTKKSCGFFHHEKLECWEGDGAPVDTGIRGNGGGKIAMGADHWCAAYDASGAHMKCEGSNAEGQLGAESEWIRSTAAIKLVTAGEATTCVAYDHGEGILCRGRGAPKDIVLAGNDFRDLQAGKNHTCAVSMPGRLYCWGKNDAGQLGDGTTNDAAMPTAVTGIEGVLQVAIGDRHTCVLLANRTVSCFGANDRHQLADGTTQGRGRPGMVLGVLGVWEVHAAGDGTCVRFGTEGELRCWGANDHGQLGDGSTVEHTVPAPIKFH